MNDRDITRRDAVAATALAALAAPAAASEANAQITMAALDYIQGFYTGDAARMERALHPELAKRILHVGGDGRERLEQMSALTLIQNTRAAAGRFRPDARAEVRILDQFQNTATARVDAETWVDFLHLVFAGGRWQIVNVLWEVRRDQQ